MPSGAKDAATCLLCFDASKLSADRPNHGFAESLRTLIAHTAFANEIRVHLPKATAQDGSAYRQYALDEIASLKDTRVAIHPPLSDGLDTLFAHGLPRTRELLFVTADILVPPGWDTRLRQLAAQDPRIANVSPLCTGIPPLTEGRPWQPIGQEDWLAQDSVLNSLGGGSLRESSPVFPLCTYLRPDRLEQVARGGGLKSDKLTSRIEQAGLISLTATNVLVRAPKHVGDSEATAAYLAAANQEAQRFSALRKQLKVAIAHRESKQKQREPGPAREAQDKPVQLHIAHSWGGGLGRWIDDFVDGDSQRSNLILKSVGNWGAFGCRLELLTRYSGVAPLRVWSLSKPIQSTDLARLEYRQILDEIRRCYAVQAVLVSSLIGHALDALRTGLPTVVIAHDHYPYCITLYAHFEEPCGACDNRRLANCLDANPGHRFFRHASATAWQSLREVFLENFQRHPVTLVAPSGSVLQRWLTQMPGLKCSPKHVIPHGIGLPASPSLAGTDRGRLRIVVLGILSWEKGLVLLQQALPGLCEFADIVLLGCGTAGRPFANRPGVSVKEQYSRAELATELAAIRPHLGLLCSLVPETFSYTLSELHHFGIPVIATRVGSFTERIEQGETGFLYDPQPDDLVAAVRACAADREGLDRVRRTLAQAPGRDLAAMVVDYHAILPVPPVKPGREQPMPSAAAAGQPPALHIQPDARYRQVLYAFARYSLAKLVHSPRLGAWFRRTLTAPLRRAQGANRPDDQAGAD